MLFGKPGYPLGLRVPCGKCMACRIAKRREWAARMLHELSSWDDAVFVTLTYNDDHNDDSLHKRDLQLFIKRLRKSLGDRRIRYFACGEYGEQTERPHYHMILFGLSLRDEDKQLIMDAWPYCSWDNPAIRKNSFGIAEPDSIRYVAQYIDKKFTGDLADEEYTAKGREPVFKIQSLGIGRKWLEDNQNQLRDNMCFTLRGVRYSLPRYYLNKLDISPDAYKDAILESERSDVERHTGIAGLTRDEAYFILPPADVVKLETEIKNSLTQHDRNLRAKAAQKRREPGKE